MTRLINGLLCMALLLMVLMAEYHLIVHAIFEPFQLGGGIAVIVLAWSAHHHAARFIKAKYENHLRAYSHSNQGDFYEHF